MKKLIVVNNPKDWDFKIDGVEVVSAKRYLTENHFVTVKNLRVFNLCRHYKYQSKGYYVSLLAAARGHKVIPNITTIQDLKSQTIVKVISDELDELIQKSFKKIKSESFVLSIYFGQNISKQYNPLCKELYNLFQAPLLRAKFVLNKTWQLQNIGPIPVNDIDLSHKEYLEIFANDYFGQKRFSLPKISKLVYDLAILYNLNDNSPPSDRIAIDRFMSAAEDCGFYVELISKEDFSRISEFDALFIRETTAVNHYTYRFSRRAKAEGLVVIDDPDSILRCTNKVYLAEVLTNGNVLIPKTMIIHKENKQEVEGFLGLPCVLKRPDSSFSHGVVKVNNSQELKDNIQQLLSKSDLIIGQEFLPTQFDWRIGVIDGKAFYACKYFMADKHWQIYNWEKKKNNYGKTETYALDQVPPFVIHTAVKASNLIGDGLYGVDIKEINGKAYVIEVNDNPSLDHDTEDRVLGEELYLTIMKSFRERVEKSKKI